MKIFLIVALVTMLVACTENESAKGYGGTAELSLPANRKLINVTWKETNLWYLTRPMNATDSVETYEFHEESSYGVWEGTYIIHETK